MNVIGLDLSLTCTGLADVGGVTRSYKPKTKGMRRLADIDAWVFDHCRAVAHLVVIEGYSMGGQKGSSGVAQALGELGGVVRIGLWRMGIPYVDCPPSSLKKYACGTGNASKGMVLEAASKRSGLDFGGDDNRADAWWLRAMALDHYGEPVIAMPAVNRSALAGVAWPELPGCGREERSA